MSYATVAMHPADLSDLKCPRCGYTPEAECYYVGEGCWEIDGPDRDRIEGYTECEECGWYDVSEPFACRECGCDLTEDAWDDTLCEECRAEVCVPS